MRIEAARNRPIQSRELKLDTVFCVKYIALTLKEQGTVSKILFFYENLVWFYF